jgi:hypothetical protein
MMLSFSCVCVCVCVLRKYWSLSWVTWRIFYSDTFPQISQSFLLYKKKNAIRFCHWSSWATPGTPASIMYIWVTIATVIFYETLLFLKHVLELQLVWPSESPSLASQVVCKISMHVIQANVTKIKFR